MKKTYDNLSLSTTESREQEIDLKIGEGENKDTILNLGLSKEQTKNLIKGLIQESNVDKEEIVDLIEVETVQDVMEVTGLELWKWEFSRHFDNYVNIDDKLKEVGYELKDKNWIGEYGDVNGYRNCKVVKVDNY